MYRLVQLRTDLLRHEGYPSLLKCYTIFTIITIVFHNSHGIIYSTVTRFFFLTLLTLQNAPRYRRVNRSCKSKWILNVPIACISLLHHRFFYFFLANWYFQTRELVLPKGYTYLRFSSSIECAIYMYLSLNNLPILGSLHDGIGG